MSVFNLFITVPPENLEWKSKKKKTHSNLVIVLNLRKWKFLFHWSTRVTDPGELSFIRIINFRLWDPVVPGYTIDDRYILITHEFYTDHV